LVFFGLRVRGVMWELFPVLFGLRVRGLIWGLFGLIVGGVFSGLFGLRLVRVSGVLFLRLFGRLRLGSLRVKGLLGGEEGAPLGTLHWTPCSTPSWNGGCPSLLLFGALDNCSRRKLISCQSATRRFALDSIFCVLAAAFV